MKTLLTSSDALDDDPLWFKDATIYQLHVRSFADGYHDGIGDFRGLTERLGYLQDLGVTALWLMPFYPSPLKDDGYDISDYTNIHPNYGTIRDFEVFLHEAHRRGLRVITELVLNHTSDQHPWFQRPRRADPGTVWRDFYVWSDTPDKYADARIIFQDFEISNWTYDPVARAYYWHRFYSHQPDLNYHNPEVRESVLSVLDFWLGMGVDGLRLDAVPYLFEREGTNCENLPETHAFLKDLRKHIDERYANRMLLAEANQWPEDAVAYFGEGDESHMAFHFPLMPRLFMAIRMEDRFPIVEIMAQTPAIPPNCQWAVFLRNHDELTLEMVTDEERDYMVRVYAQDKQARINLGIRRRLAPLLENNRRRIELMMGVLFSMPGTPIVYYGDEIGMGDNIYLGDRNGVRTPMQWSPERNAGFSRANPQRLVLPVVIDPEYHYQSVNVETQQANPSSLLWWTKRIIALRKRYPCFGRGSLEFIYPSNSKVLAFLRRDGDVVVLVVANLARYHQWVELDLQEFRGQTPIELFGHTPFPVIDDRPYFLSLGPYALYWFAMETTTNGRTGIRLARASLPVLHLGGGWPDVYVDSGRAALEMVLPTYLAQRQPSTGRRTIETVDVVDSIRVPFADGEQACLAFARVGYTEGEPETVAVALFREAGPEDAGVIARIKGDADVRLRDAIWNPEYCATLLELIADNATLRGGVGELQARAAPRLSEMLDRDPEQLRPDIHRTDRDNVIVRFGRQLVLKVFRSTPEGPNPDEEMSRFLTVQHAFANAPKLVGSLVYQVPEREPTTLAILHEFVPDTETGWHYTLSWLSRFFERALASTHPPPTHVASNAAGLLERLGQSPPAESGAMFEGYLEWADLLGRRTAELHHVLAGDPSDAAFAPEPVNAMYQRSIYQTLRNVASHAFQALKRSVRTMTGATAKQSQLILEREGEVMRRFRDVLTLKLTFQRIRTHGDYHLGQLLHTGKNFVVVDFEGDPTRSIGERRLKRSALRDVASMLRSFHYSASAVLLGQVGGTVFRDEDHHALEAWADFWWTWASGRFLDGYFQTAGNAPYLPSSSHELTVMLDCFLLEKTLHELAYDLASRPDWVRIPLRGLLDLLEVADS